MTTMRDSSSAPIPVPFRRRGLILLVRFAPVLIFAVVGLVCYQLWDTRLATPSFVAKVEQRTAEVRAPVDGQLQMATNLGPLQQVVAGEVIAWIQPISAALAEAELQVLRGELDAMVAHPGATMDQRRVDLETTRLQLDWMQARVDLAELQALLRTARYTVQSYDELGPASVIDELTQETARADLQGLELRVAAQAEIVAQLEPNMDRIRRESANAPAKTRAFQAMLATQEARLRALELRMAPHPLTAPFDGVVLNHRYAGEQLLAGDIVATLGAADATRIVGYERQPGLLEAEVGDQVLIASRREPSNRAEATLLEVSPTLELVPVDVLAMWRSTLPETGRRFQFSVPDDLSLIPGEQVEITLIR
jgi:multidrug resistance efflux pump